MKLRAVEAETPIRVRVVRATHGLRAGQAAWVAGSGVQKMIDNGTFVLIGEREQRQRLYRVGTRNYGFDDARRISKATGQPMVEVA